MSRTWTGAWRSAPFVDLRSLALLRALLALLLLADALGRLAVAPLLYADSGLLPRAEGVALMSPLQASLHLVHGSATYALSLTLAQAGAALALLLGWRTRLATLACWALLLSACARNPAVVSAAEAVMLALLFWALFVPWDARWSVDAARSAAPPAPAPARLPTAVLLWLALLLPLADALSAQAWQALGNPYFQTLFALGDESRALTRWLGGFPALLALLDAALAWGAVLVIACTVAAAVSGLWMLRRAALALYLALALLTLLTRTQGLLPWVYLACAALLVDAALWERLARRGTRAPRLYVNAGDPPATGAARLLRSFLAVPGLEVLSADHSPRAARLLENGVRFALIDADEHAHLDTDAMRALLIASPLLRPLRAHLQGPAGTRAAMRVTETLLRLPALRARADAAAPGSGPARLRDGLLLAVALLMGVGQLGALGLLPQGLGRVAATSVAPLGLDLSAPLLMREAPRGERWLIVTGERFDGRPFDLLHAGTSRLDTPQPRAGSRLLPGRLEGERARRLAASLMDAHQAPLRLAFARHLCRQAGPELVRLRIAQMLRPLQPADAPVEQQILLRHDCSLSPAEG